MCKQNFTVVAGRGGATFNYCVVLSSGSQPGGQVPQKGHKINLKNCEINDGVLTGW